MILRPCGMSYTHITSVDVLALTDSHVIPLEQHFPLEQHIHNSLGRRTTAHFSACRYLSFFHKPACWLLLHGICKRALLIHMGHRFHCVNSLYDHVTCSHFSNFCFLYTSYFCTLPKVFPSRKSKPSICLCLLR